MDSEEVDPEVAYWLSLSDDDLDDLSESMDLWLGLVAPAAGLEWVHVTLAGSVVRFDVDQLTLSSPLNTKSGKFETDLFSEIPEDRYILTG